MLIRHGHPGGLIRFEGPIACWCCCLEVGAGMEGDELGNFVAGGECSCSSIQPRSSQEVLLIGIKWVKPKLPQIDRDKAGAIATQPLLLQLCRSWVLMAVIIGSHFHSICTHACCWSGGSRLLHSVIGCVFCYEGTCVYRCSDAGLVFWDVSKPIRVRARCCCDGSVVFAGTEMRAPCELSYFKVRAI